MEISNSHFAKNQDLAYAQASCEASLKRLEFVYYMVACSFIDPMLSLESELV